MNALLCSIATAVLLLLPCAAATQAQTDEGWVIRSFQAAYGINQDGSVDVTEDITVDFGTLSRHGIFRDIPVEYAYDTKHRRRVALSAIGVDDGQSPVKYQQSREGDSLRLKIGDPNKTVTGQQRYRIRYKTTGGLNPQPSGPQFRTEAAELYWNVTGNSWPVRIETATAVVTAPAMTKATCFEGPTGSTATCQSRPLGVGPEDRPSFQFSTTRPLPPNAGLTIVVGLPEGAVQVPPLDLVRIKSAGEQVRDFIGIKPLPIALAALVVIAGVGLVLRYWWLNGRDRWFGDVHYLRGGDRERARPLFARDTVVVEYQPPELKPQGRRLRPAEIGVLLDERADTLDVSATIVDLAVRGYLRITELPKQGLFGHRDYKLERLKPSDDELLPYEKSLMHSLFDAGDEVTMSSLEKKFYEDLAIVKAELYEQAVDTDKYFAGSPQAVRRNNAVFGVALIAAGVAAALILGGAVGAAIIGVPIALAGLLLVILSQAMPRRTAIGREMLRRSLGFREYMEVAETDRQRFYEETGIFERYLPFAIVFGCTEKWAKAFEGIGGRQPQVSGWYVGPHSFAPVLFASNINSFSSAMSSAIASTPGGSGGSGFSGGGFSGGGVGGGGGGSW